MKFEATTSALEVNKERGFERVTMGWAEPCESCGEQTNWTNIAFLAPCCSHECTEALWAEYWVNFEQAAEQVRAGLGIMDVGISINPTEEKVELDA